LELPEDDTNVSKGVGVIIVEILLKTIYIYSALLVEIRTIYTMPGTYIKIVGNLES